MKSHETEWNRMKSHTESQKIAWNCILGKIINIV